MGDLQPRGSREIVDLDALGEVGEPRRVLWAVPVPAAEPPGYRIEDSPLYGRTRLAGRIVTDPDEIAEIGRDIAARRPGRRWARVLSWLRR